MTIPVHWCNLNPNSISRGFWDQAMIEDLLDGSLWDVPHRQEVEHFVDSDLADFTYGVVVVPARHNANRARVIADRLSRADWALVILTGDEEHTFDVGLLTEHATVWVMHPGEHTPGDVFIGSGYAPFARGSAEPIMKDLDWFFSGQITHERRRQCADALENEPNGWLVRTEGFTQGLEPETYVEALRSAKIAPCPSGPVSVDNFRLYEALEAGCVPLVDGRTPAGSEDWYWPKVHPGHPFTVIEDWDSVGAHMAEMLGRYPLDANLCFSWWQQYKRDLAYRFWDRVRDDNWLEPTALGDRVTAIVTTSAVEMHPDTSHLVETVDSIAERLPGADIIIVCDGLKPEQQHHAEAYGEYVRRVTWLCATRWKNAFPLVLRDYGHQANATRAALQLVRTPYILFSEHDTPLVLDLPVDQLCDALESGEAEIIRLHHEASVLEPHQHLMLDQTPRIVGGVPLLRTVQWSQRPHFARTDFYRQMLDEFFSTASRTMIEDVMYGVVNFAWREQGLAGWRRWKLWMYAPEGDMKRSWHLDSRGEEEKYNMIFDYGRPTPQGAPRAHAERVDWEK